MQKILILFILLVNLLHSKEIIIDSNLSERDIKSISPKSTAKNKKTKKKNISSFKIGYTYSMGPLNEKYEKYAKSHSLYMADIYKSIGLSYIKKTHSSNVSYDVSGFGLIYSISKQCLISISQVKGKGNKTSGYVDVEGIDTSLLFLKNNYGFSLGYDSILKQFNIGITIFKGFK